MDARILSGWLIAKNDPALFEAYRSFGPGRLKLLHEHIKDDLGDDPPESAREMLEHFDRRVNLEREDWSQSVNLGAFTDASQRDMAIEAGLKREFPRARPSGSSSCSRDPHTTLPIAARWPPIPVPEASSYALLCYKTPRHVDGSLVGSTSDRWAVG